jgi:hypothetical protein
MQRTVSPTSLRTIAARAGRWLRRQPPPRQYDMRVGVIHDPHTPMQLISVSGHVTPVAMAVLAAAFAGIADGAPLHLDLTGAVVDDSRVLRHTELLIDQLERRQVKIRIVGLDPEHPVLTDTSRI